MRFVPLMLAVAMVPAAVHAAPFSPFDVRAAGMGGTGVASAKSASAAMFNPAMLSAQLETDKFQFLLGAGGAVTDANDLLGQIDGLQQSIDRFRVVNRNLNGANSVTVNVYSPALEQAAAVGKDLVDRLVMANNDAVAATGGAGLSIGVPGPKLGVGVFIGGQAHAVATPMIAGSDVADLYAYYERVKDGIIGGAAAPVNELQELKALVNANGFLSVQGGGGQPVTVTINQPQSQADGVALALVEYGLALSHRFDLAGGGQLSVGVTPKAVEAATFDYVVNVESWDEADIDTSNAEKTDSAFDFDAGVVYRADAASPWQFGVTAKNLAGNTFDTVRGRQVEVAPQLRAGVARMTAKSTVAVDLDLTENEGIRPRANTQFLALGAEYDLKYLQLRCGLRANLADSEIDDALSAGLGLGPIDLSVIGNEHDVGANLQIGFGW